MAAQAAIHDTLQRYGINGKFQQLRRPPAQHVQCVCGLLSWMAASAAMTRRGSFG
jgi:hypothetical protein